MPKKDRINQYNRSGDLDTFCLVPESRANLNKTDQEVKALAIDRYDNVFVIIKVKKCTGHKNLYVLFAFDSSGNVQYERVLDFLKSLDGSSFFSEWSCVATNDGDLMIQSPGEKFYVCNSSGNLKYFLSRLQPFPHLDCVTDQNEIVIHTISDVLLFTKEGEIKRKVTVNGIIESVIFNFLKEIEFRKVFKLHSQLLRERGSRMFRML